MTDGPPYRRARKVAELLDLSERTIRRWIADGTLPSVKMGGARLVVMAELERRLTGRPEPDPDDVPDDDPW